MLNIFPIQFLALFAYLILRVFIAGILIYLGTTHLYHKKELSEVLKVSWFPFGAFTTLMFGVGELVLGAFILAGAYTQICALFLGAMSLKMIMLRGYFNHPTIPPKIFYVLLLGCSLTLFITGAGVLAFDLPI